MVRGFKDGISNLNMARIFSEVNGKQLNVAGFCNPQDPYKPQLACVSLHLEQFKSKLSQHMYINEF